MSACIWIHYARPRPHWYGLEEATRAARRDRWGEVAAASVRAGGTCLGTYHVRGQHDFETVELWRFPDADAAFRHWAALTEAGYGECNAFANTIGLAGAPPE